MSTEWVVGFTAGPRPPPLAHQLVVGLHGLLRALHAGRCPVHRGLGRKPTRGLLDVGQCNLDQLMGLTGGCWGALSLGDSWANGRCLKHPAAGIEKERRQRA